MPKHCKVVQNLYTASAFKMPDLVEVRCRLLNTSLPMSSQRFSYGSRIFKKSVTVRSSAARARVISHPYRVHQSRTVRSVDSYRTPSENTASITHSGTAAYWYAGSDSGGIQIVQRSTDISHELLSVFSHDAAGVFLLIPRLFERFRHMEMERLTLEYCFPACRICTTNNTKDEPPCSLKRFKGFQRESAAWNHGLEWLCANRFPANLHGC